MLNPVDLARDAAEKRARFDRELPRAVGWYCGGLFPGGSLNLAPVDRRRRRLDRRNGVVLPSPASLWAHMASWRVGDVVRAIADPEWLRDRLAHMPFDRAERFGMTVLWQSQAPGRELMADMRPLLRELAA